ncbi:CBS domain-containing protein [Nocardioides sp. T2.26MG-1]|uniref:CBS domain-containing protein n=1 Tax=Nocardioides sp. T2.26MG-1 TaxID=3041166 RepID=UPI002477B028|nr:CBS domain-containing protein [Nocardioides sp. T2.26MG-1]CAI9407604.1 Inosine-5'-monophosphate dehydrogenase [Nocardioides sp. T2.26MG-1]
MLVQDLMTPEPMTVRPSTTVKEALSRLAQYGITCMPVVDGSGRLQGVVSEADLIRDIVAPDPRAQERPVSVEPVFPPRTVEEVYTRHPVSVRMQDDLARAVDVMTSTAVKSLPVVDDEGHLVGVVSRSDVVQVLARADDTIAADVDELLASLGHTDWLVEVSDGIVNVSGPAGEPERALAQVVAHTVPGVIEVRVD